MKEKFLKSYWILFLVLLTIGAGFWFEKFTLFFAATLQLGFFISAMIKNPSEKE